jgi:hypothetical protein
MRNRLIAMRCTQEQFDLIKPKLEGRINFYGITKFKENSYLVLFNDKNITNETIFFKSDKTVYETWNEKIFLEACGFEVKPKDVFEITKEQILSLENSNNTNRLRDWFPTAFEEERKEVVFDFWHKIKTHPKMLIYPTHEDKDGHLFGYGFNKHGCYEKIDIDNSNHCLCNSIARDYLYKATRQEAEEALKNEAVRRGFEEGVYCISALINEVFLLNESAFNFDEEGLRAGCVLIFNYKTGKWATIVETITKEEAEKFLNKKIL